MGQNYSSQEIQNTFRALTSIVNTTMNNATQNLTTTCQASNILNAQFGVRPKFSDESGTVIEWESCEFNAKNVNIEQVAEGSCTLEGGLTSSLNSNITNDISNAIQQKLEQGLEQSNDFLSAALNSANMKGINTTDLSQMIANTISSNLSQRCDAFITASNRGMISYCGNFEDGIFIGQKAIANNLTSCVASTMMDSLASNTVLNEIAQDATQKASQTNKGIGALTWVLIAGAIFLVVCVVGYYLYTKNQTPEEKLAKAEAKKEKAADKKAAKDKKKSAADAKKADAASKKSAASSKKAATSTKTASAADKKAADAAAKSKADAAAKSKADAAAKSKADAAAKSKADAADKSKAAASTKK